MNPEEAIKIVEGEYVTMSKWYGTFEEAGRHNEAIKMAVDALKKQIPVKPVKADEPRYGMGYEYYDWHCPTCDKFLAFETQLEKLPKVCNCGQKIVWPGD